MMGSPERSPCPRGADVTMWMLRAGDPSQYQALAAHATRCPDCKTTMREAEETFDALAATVRPVEPPVGLRARVLAAAADSPKLTATGAPPTAEPRRRRENAEHRRRHHRRRRDGRWMWFSQLEQQRNTSTAQAGSLENVLAEITRHPHAVLVDPSGRPLAAVAVDGPSTVFYNLALPPAQPGTAWVLWGLRGADATPLDTFPTTPGSTGRTVATAPGQFEAYGVTRESAGDTPAWPGEFVATGPVAPAAR